MRLIFVRHGESVGNKKNIIQGHKDFALTKKGREQAQMVAERFRNIKIDAIYSSDLKRASQTAKIIKKFHKKTPIFFSKLLRERNLGYLEGKRVDEVDFIKFRHRRPKGGETPSELKKRVEIFLNYLFKKYSTETILVVTHGGVIRMLYGIVNKKTIKECYDYMPSGFLANTCVFELEDYIDKKKRKIFKTIRENCTRHLNNF
jgi:broad specificity phosphatase PhoE